MKMISHLKSYSREDVEFVVEYILFAILTLFLALLLFV
jgi:hypothetical protein